MTAIEWLRANNYEDVAELARAVEAELKARGSKQRRDWFLICAGGKDGKPRTVSGREFPVIRALQIRHGLPVTPNAISRSRNEEAPAIERKGRWAEKSKRKTSKKTTTKKKPSSGSR